MPSFSVKSSSRVGPYSVEGCLVSDGAKTVVKGLQPKITWYKPRKVVCMPDSGSAMQAATADFCATEKRVGVAGKRPLLGVRKLGASFP